MLGFFAQLPSHLLIGVQLMRRLCLPVLVSFALCLLLACGSGSSHSTTNPIFTSTPITAAEQGVAYSYQVAATDPSGEAVSFSLTAGPSGAALSGNTVSWTPTAAESRVSNNFTVTAMTSSGGSATQSWTVTPNGTITVNWINTNWSPNGPVQVAAPATAALDIEALVPQADGSITILKGSATSTPGMFTIANVPASNYWLGLGSGAFWTSATTFDAGSDIAGAQTPFMSTPSNTTIDLNVNIASEASQEWLEFFTDPITGALEFSVPAGTTDVIGAGATFSNVDWTQINNGFLMQYVPETLGSQNIFVLGPELNLSNLAFTNGSTNNVSGTLNAAVETSLNLSVTGSQWASAFDNVGPANATVQDSILMLTAEPYVVGVNAVPFDPFLPALALADPSAGGVNVIFTGGNFELINPIAVVCSDFTGELSDDVTVINPPIQTDENLGTLQYGDPFDPTWTRAMAFCEQATVPISLPNSSGTYNFLLVDGGSVVPSNSPLVPTSLPVVNPAINGTSLFTAATISTDIPTLSWTAPTGISPYGYKVHLYALTTLNGGPYLLSEGIYNTSETSVTLPPLPGGNTYIFTITTEVDGVANMQTSPFRSALPTGFASIVSAPITVSASSAMTRVHGDIEDWRRVVDAKNNTSPHPELPGFSRCKASGNAVGAFCE
jgi:hypothetical protein